MTKNEAKIILLENKLKQARNIVQFLHSCLTIPGYKYTYPESTIKFIKEINDLVPVDEYCNHSRHNDSCPSCVRRTKNAVLYVLAKSTLGLQ